MTVDVYTAPACMMCKQTKRHLEQRGIDYTEQPLNGHAAQLADQHGLRHAPVVVAGDQVWDGYRPDRIDALIA